MEQTASQKIITCILPKGKGMPLVRVLTTKHGLTAVDMHYARGVGRITPLRHRGIGETPEREIVTIETPEAQADALFELIYEIAEINRPHGGLMYMHAATRSTGFTLPELPEES